MSSKVHRLVGILIILYLIISLAVYYTSGTLISAESYAMDAILLIFALYFIFVPKTKITPLSNWALFLIILLSAIELLWFMSGVFSWMTWLWPIQRLVYTAVFWIRYGLAAVSFILVIVGFIKSK